MRYLSVTLTATAVQVLFHSDYDVRQLSSIAVSFNVTQTSGSSSGPKGEKFGIAFPAIFLPPHRLSAIYFYQRETFDIIP